MYIKQEDFKYLEGLYKTLDAESKKKLLDSIANIRIEREEDIRGKIEIVGDDIFDVKGIDPKDFITRTAIKKAYKAIKETTK